MISSSQRPLPDNTRHSQQTNIHVSCGIRTHDPSRRAAADLRLRPCGHWDRHILCDSDTNNSESGRLSPFFLPVNNIQIRKILTRIKVPSAAMLKIQVFGDVARFDLIINPLNPELNPICYLLALLGAHHFLHVNRIRVKLLTLR